MSPVVTILRTPKGLKWKISDDITSAELLQVYALLRLHLKVLEMEFTNETTN